MKVQSDLRLCCLYNYASSGFSHEERFISCLTTLGQTHYGSYSECTEILMLPNSHIICFCAEKYEEILFDAIRVAITRDYAPVISNHSPPPSPGNSRDFDFPSSKSPILRGQPDGKTMAVFPHRLLLYF